LSELVDILVSNQHDKSQPPHLSASSLSLHMRCPRQWQQAYIHGERGGPNDALMIGTSVHLALSRMLMGQDPGNWLRECLDKAAYSWEDDRSADIAAAMVYHYWETIGKHLPVVATEREFLVSVPGVEIPILGYIDVETSNRLIDFKTTRYFSRKGVRPNKEWRFAQGIYQLEIQKPSEVHVLTRAKADPVVVPDSTSHPLHFGLIDTVQVQRTVQYEWNRIQDNFERYGVDKPWPGNPNHDWVHKYCGLEDCCLL